MKKTQRKPSSGKKTPKPSAAPRKTTRLTIAGAALLAVLALAAFLPALSAGFLWDDDQAILENPLLRNTPGLWTIWAKPSESPHYFPLSYSSFWFEHQLWGARPFGYHLVNLLLHASNAVLLFFLLRRMGFAAAWPAAALFAVHPVQAATVCWVIERKNLLCALFYILAFAAWLRFEKSERRRWHVLSLGLFLLAMLGKSIAVTFPLAALIFAWWKTGRIEKRTILRVAPFFLLGAAVALVSLRAHQGQIPDYGLTALQKCLLAARALCFYAAKLFWPADFMGVYPRWEIDPAQAWQCVFPLLVVGAFVAAWALRRQVGRGPLAALAFYAVSLAPILGFIEYSVMEYSWVHDHHQYLAAAGIFILAASGLERLFSNVAGRLGRGTFPTRAIPWTALILLLSVLSWNEARAYRDMETFFGRNLERNPKAWPAMINVGTALMKRDALPEAEEMFRRALELKPASVYALRNLGTVLLRQGKREEALRRMNEALALAPEEGSLLASKGRILAEMKRYEEARGVLERALEKNPESLELLNNLAICLLETGDEERAELILRRILQLDPTRAAAHANLGALLLKKGDTPGAREHLTEALRLDPNNAAARANLERL